MMGLQSPAAPGGVTTVHSPLLQPPPRQLHPLVSQEIGDCFFAFQWGVSRGDPPGGSPGRRGRPRAPRLDAGEAQPARRPRGVRRGREVEAAGHGSLLPPACLRGQQSRRACRAAPALAQERRADASILRSGYGGLRSFYLRGDVSFIFPVSIHHQVTDGRRWPYCSFPHRPPDTPSSFSWMITASPNKWSQSS